METIASEAKSDRLKKTIEHVGTGIPPKGDWMPTLIYEKDGKITIMGMAGVAFKDDLDRKMVANLITRTLQAEKADAAVWIVTAWALMLNQDPTPEELEKGLDAKTKLSIAMSDAERHIVHTRPDKVEIVGVLMAERGNPMVKSMMARIKRTPDSHPTLAWEPGEQIGALKGLFPEALEEGLKWQQ